MDADFWHQRWNTQQIAFHQQQVNPLLQQYWPQLPFNSDARVLVPLCGKSVDMLWLLQRGHSVVGVELSPIAVAEFFTDNQLDSVRSQQGVLEQWQVDSLSLLCGDLFALNVETQGSFDVIYDRAALIALPEPMRASYVEKLLSLLSPGGEILLITLEYPPELHQGPPFSVEQQQVEQLFGGFQVDRLGAEALTRESSGFSRRGLLGSTEVVYRLSR